MQGTPIRIEEKEAHLLQRYDVESIHHRRMARDIHDTVAAHMVYANLLLGQLRMRTSDEVVRRSLDELDGELSHALQDLRSFCFLLDKPARVEEDWQRSVYDLVNGFACRANLETDIEVTVQGRWIAPPLQTVLLRILQEALVNVVRHASATRVRIRVIADSSTLTLEISDDGTGLPASPTPGVGVGSMAGRAQEMNGECRITSSPAGTTVLALFPLRN